ncbi:MAG: 1-acyl-sn-glycerol-3-phosphate acyltransferase, partial [Clostridia bacterium]|nr:1-acyl-sn-glycerol-3-phosphate acyltransferase [Clostridia bacterium]
QNLKNGRSMAIFMEGIRSRDEKHKLGKFKTGAFRMAMEAGVPLVPVIICGTSKSFEDTGEIVSAMGKVKVLDPIMIPKMDFDDLEDFIKDFREKYEDEYEDVFEEVEDMNKNFNR